LKLFLKKIVVILKLKVWLTLICSPVYGQYMSFEQKLDSVDLIEIMMSDDALKKQLEDSAKRQTGINIRAIKMLFVRGKYSIQLSYQNDSNFEAMDGESIDMLLDKKMNITRL